MTGTVNLRVLDRNSVIRTSMLWCVLVRSGRRTATTPTMNTSNSQERFGRNAFYSQDRCKQICSKSRICRCLCPSPSMSRSHTEHTRSVQSARFHDTVHLPSADVTVLPAIPQGNSTISEWLMYHGNAFTPSTCAPFRRAHLPHPAAPHP